MFPHAMSRLVDCGSYIYLDLLYIAGMVPLKLLLMSVKHFSMLNYDTMKENPDKLCTDEVNLLQ